MSLLLLALSCATLLSAADRVPSAFRPGTRILFQGDSITALGRGRDPNHMLGHSYVYLIAAKYGAMLPNRNLVFLNRGVPGNRVAEMAARWQADTIDLKPELLSILIGANDAIQGEPADKFEDTYDKLLANTVAAIPGLHLVLGEPFTLPVGPHKEHWLEWRAEIQKQQDIVAKLALKYHAAFVRYQKLFDQACRRAPADYWIWDGVHPTYSGHQLMAEEWIRTVRQFWPK